MEIVTLPIDSLKMHKGNAKLHPKEQIEQIKESIKLYGFNDPIGIWGKNNTIVEGHGRYMAAKEMGMQEVPCIRLDHLTDKQRREYMLVHNQTTMNSGWDFDLLADELDGLDFDGFDFGFDIDDDEPREVVEDDYDAEPPVEPKAKLGDIYRLGRHNIASDSKNYAADVSKAMEKLKNADWDNKFDIARCLEIITDSIAENASVYVCTSHFLAGEIWNWMKQWAEHYLYCVWSKPNPMPSLSKRHWTWNTELICYATRGKHIFNFPKEGHCLSTWTINKKNGETGHPTEKPVEVPATAIEHSSAKKQTVLDLFGGSGSTIIACEQLDRTCYMMELDPRYVDVIIDRWEKFTGEKAVKLN